MFMTSFWIFSKKYVAFQATGQVRCPFNVLFVCLSLSDAEKIALIWPESLMLSTYNYFYNPLQHFSIMFHSLL